jgi:hypothetical protein
LQAWREAVAWLHLVTGQIWGECPQTITTCPPDEVSPCLGECRCPTTCTIDLPYPASGPVTITTREGLELDIDYAIAEWHTLQIFAGCPRGCTPVDVSFIHGFPVKEGDPASRAVTLLAIALWRDACPTEAGQCPLPKGVTRLIRDGVTVEFGDSTNNGWWTGITSIDQWIVRSTWHGPSLRVITLDEPAQWTQTYSPDIDDMTGG